MILISDPDFVGFMVVSTIVMVSVYYSARA